MENALTNSPRKIYWFKISVYNSPLPLIATIDKASPWMINCWTVCCNLILWLDECSFFCFGLKQLENYSIHDTIMQYFPGAIFIDKKLLFWRDIITRNLFEGMNNTRKRKTQVGSWKCICCGIRKILFGRQLEKQIRKYYIALLCTINKMVLFNVKSIKTTILNAWLTSTF